MSASARPARGWANDGSKAIARLNICRASSTFSFPKARRYCRPRRYISYACGLAVPERRKRPASSEETRRRSAATTARAISSWMAKASCTPRSNLSDQSSYPSLLTRRALTRSRSSSLRTLPSNSVDTPNAAVITRTSAGLPLNWNEELRAATRSPATVQSASMISSAIPSHIQSWSLAGLRSAKGSTAMLAGSGLVAPTRFAFQKYQPTPGAPSATPIATRISSRRPLGAGPVRSMRPPLRSSAQASTTVNGNPMPSPTTVAESTQFGRSSPCITGSMIWSTAKEKTP